MEQVDGRWRGEGVSIEKRVATLPRWFLGKWRQRRAQAMVDRDPSAASGRTLGRALSPVFDAQLTRLGKLRPSHLIAHHLDALGIAVTYGRATGIPFFFDAEDDHLLELPPDAPDDQRQRLDSALARWLPAVAGWTTSAPLLGEGLSRRYGIPPPDATIWNTVSPPSESAHPWDGREPLRLYWSSQTIGPGRGLAEMAAALAQIHHPITWILRGGDSLGYVEKLRDVLRGSRVKLEVDPPCDPLTWPADAARAHLGLSVERGPQPNYLVNAPNKLFQALSGGLAVIATDTPGQAQVLDALPEVFCRLDPDRPETWGETLAPWLSPETIRTAQAAARAAAIDGPYSEVATQTRLAKLHSQWLSLSPAS
jgi:hypothetical protein